MICNLYGVDHKLSIKDPFGDGEGFIVYLTQVSTEKHIAYPTISKTELTNEADAKAALSRAVQNINETAAAFYGAPPSDKTGRALLEHLMENNITQNGDKLEVN